MRPGKREAFLSNGTRAIGVFKDEVRIKQIMFNLLSNAIKFPEKGKRIGVDASPAGDHVEFTVWDEGRGIDTADLGRIFDPFEQVSSSRGCREQGTGLGLSITRRLVQFHEGTIAVKSAPGEGSRFTFTIPGRTALAESAAPTSFNAEHRDGSAQGLRNTVLIVDDNEKTSGFSPRPLSSSISTC